MSKQILAARVKLPEQPSVLVVDDEKAVLLAARRLIRRYHPEWDVLQAQSVAAAHELMNEQSPWVVIADKQMPGEGGAGLLASIEDSHPLVLRVMLTGDASPQAWLEGTASAHLTFAKPYDPEAIVSVLDRAARIHQLPIPLDVKLALGRLKQLPVVSSTFTRLSLELSKDEVSMDRVVDLVSEDQALTARLLQLANSAFFGFNTEAVSIRDAVIRLGSELIRAIVLALELFHPGRSSSSDSFQSNNFSLARSVAERALLLAKELGLGRKERDRVFIAGLLHNLGALVELELDSVQDDNHQEAMLGAYLLTLWGFKAEQVELVQNMRFPSASADPDKALAALHLAWILEAAGVDSESLDRDFLQSQGLGLDEQANPILL